MDFFVEKFLFEIRRVDIRCLAVLVYKNGKKRAL